MTIQNIISNKNSVITGEELVSVLSGVNNKLELDLSNCRIREIEMRVKDVNLNDYCEDDSNFYSVRLLFSRIVDGESITCLVDFRIDMEVADKLKSEKSILSLEDLYNNDMKYGYFCLRDTIKNLIQDKFPDHLYYR